MAQKIHVIAAHDENMRLDRWVKNYAEPLPHSALEKALRMRRICLNNERAHASARLKVGDCISIDDALFHATPTLIAERTRPSYKTSQADTLFLRHCLLYEDKDIFVFNKPAGLATQGGGRQTKNLDVMLESFVTKGRQGQQQERPRLVHRLDKETSGVLLVAKSRLAAARFGDIFRMRTLQKAYYALLYADDSCFSALKGSIHLSLIKHGGSKDVPVFVRPPDEKDYVTETHAGRIKEAVTDFEVVEKRGNRALVLFYPRTGRTHQIRAHAAFGLKAPIVGDRLYARGRTQDKGLSRKLYLHAFSLTLPRANGGSYVFEAPLPDAFMRVLEGKT